MAIDDGGASAPDMTETAEPATTLTEGPFNFKDHLAPEFKDHTALQDINDVNGMAKSYISAQEMIGQQRLPMPIAEADPSEWSRFYDSVGRPTGEEGKGYEFDIPEGAVKTEDAASMETFFRKSMHDAGLSQKQAQAMYKSYSDFSGQFTEKQNNTTVDTITSIDVFNLDRYLLGSRYNESDGVVIRVRYLLQTGSIKEGDEITIEYEDVLYHGLRPIDYPRFPSTEEEEGQTTQRKLELVGHAI